MHLPIALAHSLVLLALSISGSPLRKNVIKDGTLSTNPQSNNQSHLARCGRFYYDRRLLTCENGRLMFPHHTTEDETTTSSPEETTEASPTGEDDWFVGSDFDNDGVEQSNPDGGAETGGESQTTEQTSVLTSENPDVSTQQTSTTAETTTELTFTTSDTTQTTASTEATTELVFTTHQAEQSTGSEFEPIPENPDVSTQQTTTTETSTELTFTTSQTTQSTEQSFDPTSENPDDSSEETTVPATTSQGSNKKKWIMHYHTDSWGNNLFELGYMFSMRECARRCQDYPGCVAVTHSERQGRCWLKYATARLTYNPDRTTIIVRDDKSAPANICNGMVFNVDFYVCVDNQIGGKQLCPKMDPLACGIACYSKRKRLQCTDGHLGPL